MLVEEGKGEKGCVCALPCAPRAAGTRASVRNVVPLLVTVTSAHAARSTVGALYYAPAVAYRRIRAAADARASIYCATCRVFIRITHAASGCALPREKLEISPVATEIGALSASASSRPTCSRKRSVERERDRAAIPQPPREPVPRGRQNRSRSRANAHKSCFFASVREDRKTESGPATFE